MLLVTPQAANSTIGQGGFQEVEQMALFRDMVCYQEEVRDPVAHRRGAEPRDRARPSALLGAGADQHAARFLDPGDRHRAAADRRASSGRRAAPKAIAEAAQLLSEAKFPVILNGAGVVLGGRHPGLRGAGRAARRAGLLATTSTTTPSRAAIRWPCGPLGYNGSKAAMELIAKADVVLALGTRLNPFSTLPGYGIDYWPKDGEDHPGRHQRRPHRADQAGRRSASAAMPSWWPSRSWRSWRRRPATPGARSARR